MHPEQPHGGRPLPIRAKQRADDTEDLAIDVGLDRPRAGVGCKVGIAKFELQRPRLELLFVQSAADHL